MAPCRTTPPLQFTTAIYGKHSKFCLGHSLELFQVIYSSLFRFQFRRRSSKPILRPKAHHMPLALVALSSSLKRHFRWNLERFRCQGGRHPHRVSKNHWAFIFVRLLTARSGHLRMAANMDIQVIFIMESFGAMAARRMELDLGQPVVH